MGIGYNFDAQVYKVHWTPNFSPPIVFWTRISSLTIILIFASRPLNKGKNCILLAFSISQSPILYYKIPSKKQAKNGIKRLKIGKNAHFPILPKVRIPPLIENVNFVHLCFDGD